MDLANPYSLAQAAENSFLQFKEQVIFKLKRMCSKQKKTF
jgi:hypothetical protein